MHREVINFNSGDILRKEMLDNLYHFPNDVLQCMYYEYSDGILFGMNYMEQNQKHYIMPGALKYKGDIYFQKEPICVEDEFQTKMTDSTTYYLFFHEKEVVQHNSIDRYELELSVEDQFHETGFCYKKVIFQLGTCRDVVDLENTEEPVFGLFASKDVYHYRIPSQRLKIELENMIRNKASQKNLLDVQLMDKLNEFDSISVSYLNYYISEYNSLIKNENENLSLVTKEDDALTAVKKVKCAVERYFISHDITLKIEEDEVYEEESSGPIFWD